MTAHGKAQMPGERGHIDEAKIVSLRAYGLSQKQIAERLRTSVSSVCAILRRHGVGGRRPKEKQP